MAERRMFAKTIIDSDSFIDMPTSAQALYFHLGMRADDDGFVNNPKKIQRMINASEDDLKILIAKNFIIKFASGIIVIKHWRMHNYIQSDRYKETVYTEEKKLLSVKPNKAYTVDLNAMDTECIQDVSNTDTQVRLGKNSLGKDSLEEKKIKKEKSEPVYYEDLDINEAFADYVAMRKSIKKPMTDKAIALAKSSLKKLSGGDKATMIAILNQSVMYSWQGLFPLKEKPEPEVKRDDDDFFRC